MEREGFSMGPYEYVVESIQGEYAYLRRTDIYDNGEPMMIAMPCCPRAWMWGRGFTGRIWCTPSFREGTILIFVLESHTISFGL